VNEPEEMRPERELLVLTDPEDLAATAAARLATELERALVSRPRAAIALSGGSTPWRVFELLADHPLPWARIDVHQVDERVAPAGDPARNLGYLRAHLSDHVPAVVHPMPVDVPDPADVAGLRAAADAYARTLPDSFDVIHLGLGDDGHTASLVPGDPVLHERERLVAVTEPYRGHRRMTLTLPVLDRARCVVWIVSGASKHDPLTRLLADDRSIPAGQVRAHRQLVITDQAAVEHAAG
jgi:6-phosphogluconolactonase